MTKDIPSLLWFWYPSSLGRYNPKFCVRNVQMGYHTQNQGAGTYHQNMVSDYNRQVHASKDKKNKRREGYKEDAHVQINYLAQAHQTRWIGSEYVECHLFLSNQWIWGLERVSSICVIEIENCNGDYIFIHMTMKRCFSGYLQKPKGHDD
jgi:hypothetical protein